MTRQALLSARDIHISFGGVAAASGVNLDVLDGERLAIIGPNGAGKTTFINISTGYLRPQSGTVTLDGVDITRRAPRQISRLGVARSFQIPQLFSESTVLENMLLAAAARTRAWHPFRRLDDLPERQEMFDTLELLGVADVADRVIGELPEGTRKLIDIAVALALRPRLLLMDEPTSGVSTAEKYGIMETLVAALSERSVTAVFVEHDMEVVTRYADRVAVWSSGHIAKLGTPDEVMADADVLREVVGI
jgi:branched-chain amino acid transport system ATP-binding protein